MSAIDGWLEGFLHGEVGVGVILLISMVLGLRHASDPDHLAAVTTLIASEEERHQVREAGIMGFLWVSVTGPRWCSSACRSSS